MLNTGCPPSEPLFSDYPSVSVTQAPANQFIHGGLGDVSPCQNVTFFSFFFALVAQSAKLDFTLSTILFHAFRVLLFFSFHIILPIHGSEIRQQLFASVISWCVLCYITHQLHFQYIPIIFSSFFFPLSCHKKFISLKTVSSPHLLKFCSKLRESYSDPTFH